MIEENEDNIIDNKKENENKEFKRIINLCDITQTMILNTYQSNLTNIFSSFHLKNENISKDLGILINKIINDRIFFDDNEIISIKNKNIISYWKSLVNDPELCVLLSIVDDVWFKPGQKRKDLLNPNIKYIGISSKQFGKNFCVYFVLLK